MSEPIPGMTCPRCGAELSREICTGGSQLTCPACDGRAITVAMLRRFAPRDAVREVWRLAVIQGEPSPRSCPGCTRSMSAGSVPVEHGEIEIEGCRGCQLLWFDSDELKAVSPNSQEPSADEPDEMALEHERWLVRQRDQSRRELLRRLETLQARWAAGDVML